jgi:hypothetical protein
LAISETFSLNKIGDFDSNYIAAGKIMTPRKIAIFCRRKWIDSPKILIVTFAKPATTVLMGGVLVVNISVFLLLPSILIQRHHRGDTKQSVVDFALRRCFTQAHVQVGLHRHPFMFQAIYDRICSNF